jgi:hypothetical protein
MFLAFALFLPSFFFAVNNQYVILTEYLPLEFSPISGAVSYGNHWEIDNKSIDAKLITTIAENPFKEGNIVFALRMRGEIPEGSELFARFMLSNDGKYWHSIIEDPEIEKLIPEGNVVPDTFHIFSDVHFTDDPPERYIRVELTMTSSDDGYSPCVYEPELIFIDGGRTKHEVKPTKPLLRESESASCPMPSYITRSGWGCAQGDTSTTWRPSYRDAWIWCIHHTAGSTATPSDPASVMRSIWNYHTFTNGWGDIGYQFVLDHLGNIYQGRANGNLSALDAIGAHVGGHNTGCVGMSLMEILRRTMFNLCHGTPCIALFHGNANKEASTLMAHHGLLTAPSRIFPGTEILVQQLVRVLIFILTWMI